MAYQGPADYHDHDADYYRDQPRRAAGRRYDHGLSYRYGQLQPQPLPQPPRPVAVAIQIQL